MNVSERRMYVCFIFRSLKIMKVKKHFRMCKFSQLYKNILCKIWEGLVKVPKLYILYFVYSKCIFCAFCFFCMPPHLFGRRPVVYMKKKIYIIIIYYACKIHRAGSTVPDICWLTNQRYPFVCDPVPQSHKALIFVCPRTNKLEHW